MKLFEKKIEKMPQKIARQIVEIFDTLKKIPKCISKKLDLIKLNNRFKSKLIRRKKVKKGMVITLLFLTSVLSTVSPVAHAGCLELLFRAIGTIIPQADNPREILTDDAQRIFSLSKDRVRFHEENARSLNVNHPNPESAPFNPYKSRISKISAQYYDYFKFVLKLDDSHKLFSMLESFAETQGFHNETLLYISTKSLDEKTVRQLRQKGIEVLQITTENKKVLIEVNRGSGNPSQFQYAELTPEQYTQYQFEKVLQFLGKPRFIPYARQWTLDVSPGHYLIPKQTWHYNDAYQHEYPDGEVTFEGIVENNNLRVVYPVEYVSRENKIQIRIYSRFINRFQDALKYMMFHAPQPLNLDQTGDQLFGENFQQFLEASQRERIISSNDMKRLKKAYVNTRYFFMHILRMVNQHGGSVITIKPPRSSAKPKFNLSNQPNLIEEHDRLLQEDP
jgi:hypothetical protein